MKILTKIITILILLFGIYFVVNAGAVDIIGGNDIEKVSIPIDNGGGDVQEFGKNLGFDLLSVGKSIIEGIFVIYIVYVGATMIMSMGSDEEKLTSSKRQLWYSLIAIIFINIPGTLYQAFNSDLSRNIDGEVGNTLFTNQGADSSIIFGVDFGYTFDDKIIGFFKIIIFASAVVMLIIAGINVLTSRGKEEKITEAKNKVLYSILALVFLGFMEAWKSFAFNGSVDEGINIFENIANLSLFFAVPVAVFFLSFAGYYYITANGDEEKVKKAKSIVINTVLGTLVLLAAYTFLLDLATL